MLFAGVAVVLFVSLYFLLRTGELFQLSIRRGKVLVVRGRVPPMFVSDVRSLLVSPLGPKRVVKNAKITARKTERGGELAISGDIDAATKQRLRNTFSLYSSARLVHAPPIKKPTLGQILGIASVAWLFENLSSRS